MPVHVYHHIAALYDMDPLSVTASIIALLQLLAKVISYLSDVKDTPKDRA